ncbi:MAG: hypothetical protein QM783_02920 [Phycisphaerales bacterium]
MSARCVALAALVGSLVSVHAVRADPPVCGAWLPVQSSEVYEEYRSIVQWDADGDGPAPASTLLVGGYYGGAVSRWDGTTTTFDPSFPLFAGTVYKLFVFNGQLIAAGDFDGVYTNLETFETAPINRIARWTGTTWEQMGEGFANGQVNTLAVYNGQLIAGGTFTTSGANTVRRSCTLGRLELAAAGLRHHQPQRRSDFADRVPG